MKQDGGLRVKYVKGWVAEGLPWPLPSEKVVGGGHGKWWL